MIPNQILCENEPIHLCGRVQHFGLLLILDQKLSISGISENWGNYLQEEPDLYLEQDAVKFLSFHFADHAEEIKERLDHFSHSIEGRSVIELKLGQSDYYLSIYRLNEYIYLEFEATSNTPPSWLNLYSYSKKIDRSNQKVWEQLCESVHDVIRFDRVMIYQFLEDGSGKVIAERVAEDCEPHLGLRYPEFDIPKQARALYLIHPTRLTSDISAPTYAIRSQRQLDFDLTYTTIRALSPVHLQYLENAGAQSSISFSIIVHDKLWGLVTCQHRTAKAVDLAQRHLAVLLTQYAVTKYLSNVKEKDIQLLREINTFELELKEKLLIKNDILSALSSSIQSLGDLIHADGVAIRYSDRIITHGAAPSPKEIESIHQYINGFTDKLLFKDHNFLLNHSSNFSFCPCFAGVGKVDIDSSRTFSIYWFRKEYVYEEKWAGKPEKVLKYDSQKDQYYPSPRTSFEIWKDAVEGTAMKWNKNDIYFMRRVRQLIRESMLRKSVEIKSLNKELILLNNTLDTYSSTVTHDLKNPLSTIKLSAQLMKMRKEIDLTFLNKVSTNILDAVSLMENMMSKILEFSRARVYNFKPERIEVSSTIEQIAQQCLEIYNMPLSSIQTGTLRPVWGEKTLLYQLFMNIINNAVKYSSKVEEPLITITSTLEGDWIRYEIKDNGIGIAPDELKTVYEIFKRLPNASSYEGTGIGLAIVKRIVERLNGKIDILSELGKGTTVVVRLQEIED
ncbi:ATP-binding protein [Sphingobacterium spiritivorum]|uniref:ATP-binding protein n=1 Tax=Sphingobacterium spiritivorum TaxID=258 RepID=UPI003DA33BBE